MLQRQNVRRTQFGSVLACLALALPAGQAWAVAHLTLQEVVQKVVLGNPEVLSKWHTFRAAIGDVDVAKSGFLPKLDYTFGTGRESLSQPGSAAKDFTRGGHTLTLNQMLFDGFTTLGDVRRLDHARLTRYFELVDAAEAAALEAGRAYYDVIRYRLLLLLAESNYVEHRASYEQLQRRAQTGAGRRVDVEHAASRLALAELNLHTEAANLHDVTARFIRLTGEAPPPVMFPPAGLSGGMPPSETEAVKLAFRYNPTLRAALENVTVAQHDVELRRGALYPRLDLRMRNESTDNYQGVTGTRRNNIAEIVLSYNIFNGGADMARQRLYAERRNLAFDLRDKACRDVRQTLSIAFNDVFRLRAQLVNLDLQVSSIEKTRDAYKAQFNIGQRSLLDLLDTENELLNARRTAVNSDMDLGIAYLRTQAGIGRLMEFLGVRARGIDDSIPLESDAGEGVCPPEIPGSYLVDVEALTARALAQLDAARPPVASPAPRAEPSGVPGAAQPLSAPPSMPESRPVPAIPSGARRDPPPQPASGSTAAGIVSRTPEPVKPALEATSSDRDLVAARIKDWAQAWAEGSLDRYLAFYSPDFKPADGVSREAWARKRAARVKPGAGITVDISDLLLDAGGPEHLRAEFVQEYRSSRYSDKVRKTLRWVRVGSNWLIESEVALKAGGTESAKDAR
jgi:adhesin transport system outer membrane protein